jgi:hypothetical protein
MVILISLIYSKGYGYATYGVYKRRKRRKTLENLCKSKLGSSIERNGS